jgi:general secretion pathway protein I
MKFLTLKQSNEGFTLLEVMIALAIMLIAFSSIIAIQSSAMNSALKARQIDEVSVLARNAMIQTEVEISGKKFEDIAAELSGQFEDPFQDYSWTRKIKEVKLPNLSGLAKAAGGDSGNYESSNELPFESGPRSDHYRKLETRGHHPKIRTRHVLGRSKQ